MTGAPPPEHEGPRDWFAPRRNRPAPPAPHPGRPAPSPDAPWAPGPRRVFPDEQVWPPPPRPSREEPGASTQPFPAVPAVPAVPPAPAVPAVPPAPAAPLPGTPSAAGAPRAPVPAGAAPRWRRTALLACAALLTTALAVAIPAWEDYRFYRSGNPAYRIHPVAPGGTGTLMHVAWRAEVEQADSLPGLGPAKPGRKWLKITVTRTSLDTEGVLRRGAPVIEVRHPDGRAWRAEVTGNDLPPEAAEHEVGTAYRYDVVSVVPGDVAGQVEVRVIPSTIRMPLEESTAELLKRAGTEEVEPQDRVLLFRR
ncbi:hypothetical protein [Planomonospora venezuelensis]|uniref:Uncharacterized protein n=1 Tax=Planomonospora venezuelensis TaxID=1999 RepID=A0A841CZ84_PLAVE|nr:hypothetical protein [Planomonospora venezuelensis]MBB5961418.1 hypothetical protein [Planomonospora venezuelensis]GIN03164.1 hypothetical protein Pve01_48220 [Planomonospora venezuelensis]